MLRSAISSPPAVQLPVETHVSEPMPSDSSVPAMPLIGPQTPFFWLKAKGAPSVSDWKMNPTAVQLRATRQETEVICAKRPSSVDAMRRGNARAEPHVPCASVTVNGRVPFWPL